MPPEEDEENDTEQTPSFALVVDSPHHPADYSEKVHWSNQNVQTLLDCVEKHLDESKIQKKHMQVWQTIRAEMEALGFTMEHCYNKWKNLRRDVSLLVNNPQNAVRNADILRRVARLILVIYPNVDATTMQVSGKRDDGKSAPSTPIGSRQLNRQINLPTSLHAPDSLPNGVGKHKGGGNPKCENMETNCVPGAALFPNLTSDNDVRDYTTVIPSTKGDPETNKPSTGFFFFFIPAAAALLVQSQIFTDLLRQESESPPMDEPPVHHPAASIPKENVHMRLTDMVTHLADELRAAGMRRRATLDHLLGITQGSRIPTILIQNSKQDASYLI
ncbi:hypothetical protein FBUS_09946 [Fasciolopsis buskii]|uniref:Myb/SANT-like DNA-binding domain-containing protein n=1 Tax=Fasciolopsis buskii TaxID=27845 RepID=A0A8E0VNV8_9TREM|nr:hypothetical protein FBUS_09946 [Fasciolopsis buski]